MVELITKIESMKYTELQKMLQPIINKLAKDQDAILIVHLGDNGQASASIGGVDEENLDAIMQGIGIVLKHEGLADEIALIQKAPEISTTPMGQKGNA